MKRITVVTSSRAEYGILRSVIKKVNRNFDVKIIVTGTHLLNEFGETKLDIINDGFPIEKEIFIHPAGMSEILSQCIVAFSQIFSKERPDVMLVLGDRVEILGAVLPAFYGNIPIAHIHGGDSSGGLDDSARNAISLFSTYHFVATRRSYNKVARLGIKKAGIHLVGSPAIDDIFNSNLPDKEFILDKYGLKQPYIILVQHPVTTEINQARQQILATIEAINNVNIQTIAIYPNYDDGYSNIIKALNDYSGKIKTCKSIPRKEYLSLLKNSACLVGNSSSGIIETPTLKVPAVNIGTRQNGRERSDNVLDVRHNSKEIESAILKALFDNEFICRVACCISPYGDGTASEKIAEILEKKIKGER